MFKHLLIIHFFLTGITISVAQNVNYLPHSLSEQIVFHKYFTLSYSEPHEQAQWVAYMICKARLISNTERANNFKADPLVKTKSTTSSDYTNSSYDRGHLCPAADMAFNDTAMRECFYMSNINPQVDKFNQVIWKSLETQVREWAKEKDTLFVVTGPILTEFIDTIGVKNKIPVPKYFYKIIFKYNGENSTAIAFIIPNNSTTQPLNTFITTVDEVEKQTHIDFFTELPDNIENLIESSTNVAYWNLNISKE